MTQIWAHRGASAYAPENTIEAFELALEMGADGVELDIQLSADDELMVLHDDTIDRTSSGTGKISDMTTWQLKELDFSCGMQKYAGARIPTLREVYALLAGTNMLINVELKSEEADYRKLCKKAIALEREVGMEGRILYSSFNHYALLAIREEDPLAKIGLLYECVMINPQLYAKRVGADAIHPSRYTLLVPGVVRRCHRAGIRVHTWTVDDPISIRSMLDKGVDAIITNKPDVARDILLKKEAENSRA